MLNICLSFDYELFFGENYGTDREVLFDPTYKLLKMLSDEGVSATFFVDTCSVARHLEVGKYDYVNEFTEQVKQMVGSGQDVQLHIHSHWLSSTYKNGQWIFDAKKYRLQEYGVETVKKIAREGIAYIEETARLVDPEYRCIAYRAGGFTVQPHKKIVEALYECGIRVDSSVAPRLHAEGIHSYDFRKSNLDVNWSLSSHSEWWENGQKAPALYEIPIATENKNPLFFAIKRICFPQSVKLSLGAQKGTYMQVPDCNTKKESVFKTVLRYYEYFTGYNALAMDAYKADYLYKQIKRFARKHKCDQGNHAIALIGHPKLINETYIENLRDLIRKLKEENEIRIRSVAQIYSEVDRL